MVKNPPVNSEDAGEMGQPLSWEDSLEEETATRSHTLGESRGQRSLASEGLKASDTTEQQSTRAHTHMVM